jgi:integral membrane sensor domain MASE1
LFLAINSLVLSEAAGALLLLPLSFNVRGLLLSLVFYSLVLFNNWRREKRLNIKNLKWSLAIGIFLILLILLSARWL